MRRNDDDLTFSTILLFPQVNELCEPLLHVPKKRAVRVASYRGVGGRLPGPEPRGRGAGYRLQRAQALRTQPVSGGTIQAGIPD